MTLKNVFAVINDMLADRVIDRYALGGAVAATFYLEPIATVDVDIFISLHPDPESHLLNPQPIFDYLVARGHYMEGEYIIIAGWPVQLLVPAGPLGEEALDEARETGVEGVPVRVMSAEHLAAIALETGRPKDMARLVQFVDSGVLDPRRLEDILGRHRLQEKWGVFEKRFYGDTP